MSLDIVGRAAVQALFLALLSEAAHINRGKSRAQSGNTISYTPHQVLKSGLELNQHVI